MTFAHEHLLWFLLIVPALVGLKLWVDAHGSTAERVFTAARLRSTLVTGRSLWRSWLIYSLYLLAMACLVVAVARPQWGEEKLEVPDKGRNVFIALDTSRSMLARDVAPDRLTRARLAAHDLVMELAGERVGLLAFAGRAYLQAPLTTDHDAIIEALQAFDHTILEWGGSDIADLLDVTLRAIKPLPKSNYALIIFSDGGDADQNLTPDIQKIIAAGVTIVTVGVGTEGGTLIPNPDIEGDYIRDEAGNVVRTRLESGVLQQLASATGGRYLKLGSQPLSRSVLQSVLDRLTEQQSANRQTSRPIERFAWPLGVGMVLLMLAWILSALPRISARPVGLALSLLFLSTPMPAEATASDLFGSIFQSTAPTPEQARQALQKKDFKKARELYLQLLDQDHFDAHAREELKYGLAATEHALTNYDGSIKNFSDVLHTGDSPLRAHAHQGLAHSLYDQGARGLQQQPKITVQRWRDSLRHLDAALEIEPDNADLKANRDHVAKMLEQLQTTMKQLEQQQQQKGQGQKGQKGQKQKGQKGQGQEGEGEQGQEEGEQEGQGQEGSDPNGTGEPKPKEGGGEKKGEDDGIGGKDAKELPSGRIGSAGDKEDGDKGEKGENPSQQPGEKPGEGVASKPDAKKQAQDKKDALGDQRNPDTGYTPNEASAILHQYMDEVFGRISNQQRTPPPNKKDW